MRKGSYMDVRLLAALTGLLVLAVGFSMLSLYREAQRQQMQTTTVMARTRQIMMVRADALFQSMTEEVMQESHALMARAELDTLVVVERWRALLAARWPVLGVSLADGHGNEITLQREGNGAVLRTRTVSPQRIRSTEQVVPAALDAVITAPAVLIPPLPDPRTEVWISRAMENHRDVPIWSQGPRTPEGMPGLRVSFRLRRTSGPARDRIISIHMAVDRSVWLATNALQQNTVTYFLMTDEGKLFNRMARGHWSEPVIQQAVSTWKQEQHRGQFPVVVDGRKYWFQASPYDLNGGSLQLATLIPADLADMRSRPERTALLTHLVFFLGGLALCGWLWMRRGQEIERLKRQERRTRSQELRLVKALGEREVLNREVHHRVKNNLQIVSSLLNLQATRLAEGMVREEFLRGKVRIDAMALVHHKLYELKDLREVDLDLFLRGLMQALSDMYVPLSLTVSHEVQTDGIKADQDTAITLGLILCELAGNGYQHAFPYATGGHIDVSVRMVEGDLHRLVVKDNGRGIDRTKAGGSAQLGLEIVEALADQLDGSFHSSVGTGTTLEVLFRMRPVRAM